MEKKKKIYKGVTYIGKSGKWRAGYSHKKRMFWLGHFKMQTEAARAYDRAMLKKFGRQVKLNFPLSDYLESTIKETPDSAVLPVGL